MVTHNSFLIILVVSGVSVGALNGLFISSYPKGEEI